MILTVTLNAAIDKRYVMSSIDKGEVNRVVSCKAVPGGKGLNVSKAAAAAGYDILATGLAGGYAGKAITDGLKEYNVKEDFLQVPGESRTCINIWEEDKNCQTELLEPGITISKEDYQAFLEKFKKLVEQAQIVVLSGSLPAGLNADSYKELIQIVHAQNKQVILDTSGQALVEGLKAAPDLIKPNADEIKMLTGIEQNDIDSLIAAGRQLNEKGIPNVVISLGSKGSLLISDQGCYRAIVPVIDAVNTVGCGDTMTAGLAIGLHEKMSLKDMLKNASAISAASAMCEETGIFRAEDYNQLIPEVTVTEI